MVDWHSIQGGLAILLVTITSCYQNWIRFQLDGSLGLRVDNSLPINLDLLLWHDSKKVCEQVVLQNQETF